jgi:hypothetical protein
MAATLGNPGQELKREVSPTREQRRQIYALKRAGCSRKAISEKLGLPLSDVLKTISTDNAVESERDRPLNGRWRHL